MKVGLIPIHKICFPTCFFLFPRCESPTISWLCDELVRRLSRRRQVSSQASSGGSVPDSQQIILTRALDGAELFPEDTITDILNDNEKVSVYIIT